MKLVVVVALVTVIAILGSRLSFTRLRLPLGLENLFLTGTEYVLVGLFLGSAALDLLDASTLQSLHPFMGLGLSWIGMLFGVQWELKRLLRIPPPTFAVAFLQAVATMLAVALPFYLLFRRLFTYETDIVLIGAISLAAAASDTGQSGLALVTAAERLPKDRWCLCCRTSPTWTAWSASLPLVWSPAWHSCTMELPPISGSASRSSWD